MDNRDPVRAEVGPEGDNQPSCTPEGLVRRLGSLHALLRDQSDWAPFVKLQAVRTVADAIDVLKMAAARAAISTPAPSLGNETERAGEGVQRPLPPPDGSGHSSRWTYGNPGSKHLPPTAEALYTSASLLRYVGHLQAKIDALMLEYCPSEMTQSQIAEWQAHQRPCSAETQQAVAEALRSDEQETRAGPPKEPPPIKETR